MENQKFLYEGFRFRKDRDSKTDRIPIFLQRGSNTSSWPRKSCEYIGASVTPKLSSNAPLLCAQVYDRRKRNLCKMSANVIAPLHCKSSICANYEYIKPKCDETFGWVGIKVTIILQCSKICSRVEVFIEFIVHFVVHT